MNIQLHFVPLNNIVVAIDPTNAIHTLKLYKCFIICINTAYFESIFKKRNKYYASFTGLWKGLQTEERPPVGTFCGTGISRPNGVYTKGEGKSQ